MSASASIQDVLERVDLDDRALWLLLAYAQAPRFWKKVRKSSGCWLWTGGLDKDGYGKFAITAPRGCFPKQKHVRAHRLALIMAIQKWPDDGFVTLHSCHTPICVNPEHLAFGSQAQNIRDEIDRGTFPRGSRIGTSVITEWEAAYIKRELAKGVKKALIAQRLGVARHFVYNIANGAWAHVNPEPSP